MWTQQATAGLYAGALLFGQPSQYLSKGLLSCQMCPTRCQRGAHPTLSGSYVPGP